MEPNRSRQQEIEQKKQKLAAMKASRQRQEEERRQSRISNLQNGTASRRETTTQEELNDILRSCGVDTAPAAAADSPPRTNGVADGVPERQVPVAEVIGSRNLSLELTKVSSVVIPVKDTALYSKAIQTEDDRVPDREFSLGSQEFDFDDDMGMLGMDPFSRGRTHSHELESPMTNEDLAQILPGYFARQRAEEAENVIPEEKKPEKPVELTEEEKHQILAKSDFQMFFHNASKIMERALAVREEVFSKYTQKETAAVKLDELLVLSNQYFEPKWTTNRSITAIDFCSQHKELVAVAYDYDKDRPHEPAGVVCVWNTKFKMQTPEFIFHCNSRLTSIAFAKFHQHLILAGCYSGQIAVWDYRIVTRKTPVNRSPLNSSTHTQPIFGLNIIGTQNSHNMYSVSSEGKICSWNIENLSQPVQAKELANKSQRAVPTLSVSFANDDRETFVAGAEDGKVYHFSRTDITLANIIAKEETQGHTGPVLAIHAHAASGGVDFSHLFLTSSSDWSIKLWSTKDPQIKMRFDAHSDSVVDVKWSPIHPAVFASIDEQGILLLWNLNENTENPILTMDVMNGEGILRKLTWSENGRQICIGDGKGVLHVFDTHELLYTAKNEEFIKFARVLADVKQEAEEDESLLNGKTDSIMGIGSVAGVLAGGSLATRR